MESNALPWKVASQSEKHGIPQATTVTRPRNKSWYELAT